MLVISFAIVSLVCLLVTNTAQAAFSVKYFAKAEHPQVVNGDFVSSTQLTAHQVADIYSRLSGNSPLLFEDKEDLPSIDSLFGSSVQPIILEISDLELPESVTSVLRSHHVTAVGPSAQAVQQVLKEHGVQARVEAYKSLEHQKQSVHEWIAQHASVQPVVILHHTTTLAADSAAQAKRGLKKAASVDSVKKNKKLQDDSVTELTEFEISQYQICLWTGVGFVLLLIASVGSLSNMEVIPDSLLYAKFQSARTGRSD